MPPEPTPSADATDQKIQGATTPTPGLPPMSREKILAGNILTDGKGLDSGHFVSFVLLEKVAEGGMGIVYRAQQDLPRRIVALKVMKAAAATPQTLRRFEREVAILAQLQDPAIAQLYSVGEVETEVSGTMPFLAMEFVHGSPITRYAAAHKLDTRGKLELMARVCDGVAYAQRSGVIHRDLKPSNVLVTRSGQPKILDFGLATISDASRPHDFTLTEAGQLLGTLEYMSPEQAGGQSHTVDRRTDVYALGVILFELLTGRRPVDLSSCTFVEALDQIQSASNVSLASTSRHFRGDLDVLVSKAMAKDKAQRYASAQDLADEIRRYLQHEPIQARRPTLTYRLRKYIRRNRILVTSTGAIVLALTIGLVTTARESRRANQEAANARAQADRAETEARNARLQYTQATVANGDALLALEKFDAARSAYNAAWDVLADMRQPTRNVELAIWELDQRTGRPIRVLAEDTQPVSCAAISGDQKLLALGFESGLVQVRNVWNDKVRMETHLGGTVQYAIFSPAGRFLLAGNDQRCELWDLEKGQELGRRKIDNASRIQAAISDDMVALCDDGGHLYCTPIVQFLQVVPRSLGVRDIQSLRFVGKDVNVVANLSRVLHVSGESIEDLGSFSLTDCQRINLSPDGQRMLAIGKETLVLRLPQLKPISIAGYDGTIGGGWVNDSLLWLINPNGQTIDYVGLDGAVAARGPYAKSTVPIACADQVMILPNGQKQTTLRAVHVPAAWRVLEPMNGQPITATLSQDGRIAAVACKDGRVRLMDGESGRFLGEFALGVAARLLKFDDQTLKLVAVTNNETLQVWNVPQLTKECDVHLGGSVQSWDLASSGHSCCFTLGGQAGAWNLNLDQPAAQSVHLPISFPISGITHASEDQWLLVGNTGGEIWNTKGAPQKIASLNFGAMGAERTAFLKVGSLLLTESTSKTLQLWRWDSSGLQERPLHSLPRTFLSWSLAGSSLVVRENNALTFFDPLNDCVERRMVWSAAFGRPLAFSADGRHVVALSTAGVAVLNWEVSTDLRSYESLPDELSRARWFSAAGLSFFLEAYPNFPDGSGTSLADAYGLWVRGDNQKSGQIFANSPILTLGAKALLTRAASARAPEK